MKTYLYILCSGLFFMACSNKNQPEAAVAATVAADTLVLSDAQIKNASIAVGPMQELEMASLMKVNGKVDVPPQNMVSISVPLGGYLKTSKLLPGMHVNKGEVVAVMEDQQYIQLQQDFLMAKVKQVMLEKEFARQKELNASQATSDKMLQQSESDYKTQKILVSALAQKLQLAGINPNTLNENNISKSVNIYSPIDGYVTRVNVNIGKYISPTEIMFELVNPTDIHLALKIFEKDLSKLFIGQPLIAYTNNNPDKKYDCEVLLIGKDLNAEGYTDVHCHFETYDKVLIPGTYMNAEIKVKNRKATTLPADAVVRFEGKHFAFKEVGKQKYLLTEVNIGETENGFTEIILTQKDPANFVTKGAYTLLMMLKNEAE
ncbi:MAG: efflux transporter periplasmic adaptor subunit [Sphingobacteriia bacterium 28-36-52]|jgi:cobalt-zinc-cadmium efflux system membrane fusion protein|uniref:efflux RND transporter periplasmic adaptor subunit n=1 Tax=Sediminibacterium sp. TaxID=1917865 RepID=UPI000BC4F9D5|nr:efflux RND transporter periplasmic adaptor subunit [Sediminibacterium sp.]OYW81629.1 MAG: efflux transporter periplasmic adaptor subunit [Sphingobacteriia bacterium 32-37-4]OYY09511.1 MAG: efflux transporter periplasmic adaptor subunit [Sphingobacteriia bacterium 35-36-14]OYZ02092.1 MAG: efflux transporter periplasmic adaptor subunit [Sphingobacteriia bacterium 28-36-52]OYZ53354.1 MAG: efflux transporter periplasmic adaptor subunit [Sphingobacteriia bacterium 24-36-13]OZA64764.1 MAG: efflux